MEDETLDRLFSLTEWRFYTHIKPTNDILGFTTKTIVEFVITLPFYLPITKGALFSIHHETIGVCSFKFFEVVRQESLVPGYDDAPTIEIKQTRVEMIYSTSEEIILFEDNLDLSSYFDILLEKLNYYIVAHLIKTKNLYIHRVSKEMLHFTCFFRCIALPNWNRPHAGVFYVHMNIADESKDLSEEELSEVANLVNIMNQKTNPFLQHEEMFLNARRYFSDGFYRDAILYVQISIEEFINTLYITMLIQEGKTEEEAESIREQIPFMTLIKKELHSRLGGKWDINNPSSEIGSWYQDVYLVRNAITHRSYLPKFTEVDVAIKAANNFRLYVISLVKKKRKTYPKLSEYFIVKLP